MYTHGDGRLGPTISFNAGVEKGKEPYQVNQHHHLKKRRKKKREPRKRTEETMKKSVLRSA
jgi:hypothetical protein